MKKRLFIAVKLSQSTLKSLIGFQEELKQHLPFRGIRWVDPSLFHLTLQFLGDTEVGQISTLITTLESSTKTVKPFELVVEGTGVFGSSSAVRTIWSGIRTSPDLLNLFSKVVTSTAFLSGDQRPRFSPHLTLARISDWLTKDESERIASIIAENQMQNFGNTNVTSFELIESILKPTGPVYKTIQLFYLV